MFNGNVKTKAYCKVCKKMTVISYGANGFDYICPHCNFSGDQEKPSSYIELPIEQYTFKSLNDYIDTSYRSVTK